MKVNEFVQWKQVPIRIFQSGGTISKRYRYPTADLPAPQIPKIKIKAIVKRADLEKKIPRKIKN